MNRQNVFIGFVLALLTVFVVFFQNCAGGGGGGGGAAFTSNPGGSPTSNPNLVLDLKFSENQNPSQFEDLSGQGNHGKCTSSGCPQQTTQGMNSALKFDGSKKYVTVFNETSLNPEHLTLKAWVRIDDATKPMMIVTKATATNLTDGYALYYGPGCKCFGFMINNNTDNLLKGSSNSVTQGQLYHVTATYDGAIMKIYVNGVNQASKGYSKAISHSKGALEIGGVLDVSLMNGLIDDVAVYSKALSSDEVTSSYNNEKNTYNVSGGMQLALDFAESTSPYKDVSTNNYPATCTSGKCPSKAMVGTEAVAKFAGASQQLITVPDADNLGPQKLSLEAWARVDDLSKAQFFISKTSNTTLNDGYAIGYGPSCKCFAFFVGNNANGRVNSTTQPVAGQWYHLVGTYDGSIAKIYVNGVNQASKGGVPAMTNTTAKVSIGGAGGSFWAFAALDWVRIRSEAFNDSEILNRYNSRKTIYAVAPPPSPPNPPPAPPKPPPPPTCQPSCGHPGNCVPENPPGDGCGNPCRCINDSCEDNCHNNDPGAKQFCQKKGGSCHP